MNDNAEKTKRWTITSQRLSRTLGGMLLPTVGAIADKASSFLERANAWAEANPQLAKGAAIAAGVLAGLFLVLGGGAIAIAGILAPFAALTFVAGAFNIAMLPMIGIVAAVVAGIALLAAAAYLVYANWSGITAWFSGLWASITGFFSSGIGNIAATILNWSPIGLFYQAFAGVLSWFGVALPARFTDFGRMLVNGLINGISSMFGRLKSTVVGAASSAAAWFKQKLGIRSPSRVFMGFGGFMMEGLANGIAAGEGGPIGRLEGLSRRIVGTVGTGLAVPAIATGAAAAASLGAGAGGGPGASPITIHIYPTPQQSPQDIAQAVAAELDRRERAASARNRSSFTRSEGWEE